MTSEVPSPLALCEPVLLSLERGASGVGTDTPLVLLTHQRASYPRPTDRNETPFWTWWSCETLLYFYGTSGFF